MRRYGGALANVNDWSGESESPSSLTRVTKGEWFSARALHRASRGNHGRFIPAPHRDTLVWQGRSRVGILAGGRSFRACRCRSSVHGVLALAGRHIDRLDRAAGVVAGGGVRRERQPRWAAAPTHWVGAAGISPNGGEPYACRLPFERSIGVDLGSDTTSTGNCRGLRVLG